MSVETELISVEPVNCKVAGNRRTVGTNMYVHIDLRFCPYACPKTGIHPLITEYKRKTFKELSFEGLVFAVSLLFYLREMRIKVSERRKAGT